ncbi:phosphoribosylamine--glycine ligase [Lucifera butyrica]|uniref:phosphoribosylamine--glycine ligase n=1 Tax=Lucifera butyrica TaxID=1351585 RepID=UPI000F03403F|nr:phosphoribosylamine--glycine ligase [Lucifera butyrica]
MRILVVGSGGREHALAWKLSLSPRVAEVYCAPGNPGIGKIARCVNIDSNDREALCAFAIKNKVDLTVVGPEVPLVNGIVDYFTARGLRIFGPSRQAAQIEGSKTFAKELMQKYHIPTAQFRVFSRAEEARQYVVRQGAPIVIKADGLAAGKGVVVAMTLEEALAAIDRIMQDAVFGEAGRQIVVEEYLTGEEASLLAFTDGYTVSPMVAAQDHKRIFDHDRGPNTGGMGAYAPAPVVTPAIQTRIIREILQPTVDAMRQEGCIYQGCLYAGLMITPEGPKVIEFNARFGDPETQVVLPLLDSDLVNIMEACLDGKLHTADIVWKEEAAVCVVLAAGGYPGSYAQGDVIHGFERAEAEGACVFHAGTRQQDGQIVTGGGRVLGVTASAASISLAVERVYKAVGKISFTGMQYRTDIAYRALQRAR